MRLAAMLLLATLFSLEAWAYNHLIEKRVFTLPIYKTVGGKSIHDVRVGYESYGHLNKKRDNVILVTHYFSGTSHAAGKYNSADAMAGYWDSIIGPGQALDTDKYFVISSDTLVNLNVGNPYVTTTGPASIDPNSGHPYGMTFPIVTIRDFVNVQKALLDSLGIHKLHAVIGPSMGAMQAIMWAAAYPDFVERSIPVIGAGLEANPYVIAALDIWKQPILLDSNWKQGNYYDSTPPTEGLVAALKAVAVMARSYVWADQFSRALTDPTMDPLQSFNNSFLIQSKLDAAARAAAAQDDANSLLYLAQAVQTFSLDDSEIKGIKAKILWLPASSDVLLFPEYSRRGFEKLRRNGVRAAYAEIPGFGGHMDGLQRIKSISPLIESFLDSP